MTTSTPHIAKALDTSPLDLAEAYEYCRSITRQSGSSFASAFWLLPAERRRAIHAIYAFCRLSDDIADNPALAGDRSLLLARWRDELEAVYADRSTHPVGIALADTVRRFDLPKNIFDDLLLGIESDLRSESIDTFDDLRTYCYRVASTVGLLVVIVLGCRSPQALEYAETLGIAVQLTNVLRDVSFDASSGRVYLPAEDLERLNIKRTDLASPIPGPELRTVLASYAERARVLYERAESLLPDEYRKDLRPAEAMGRIYAKLLEELHRQRFMNQASPGSPIRLSPQRRIAIAAGTWLGIGRP